jgi:putative salt-induced outer membrane protein YdiY
MGNTSAYDLMTTVIKEAETLKEDRESSYRIGVRVSYFLFVIGWALTFYGQLSWKTGRRHSRVGLGRHGFGE